MSRTTRHKSFVSAALVLLLALAVNVPSREARAEVAFGLRGGGIIDPDGIFFGGHLAWEYLPGVGALRLEPALELGLGEEGDFDYFFFRILGHGKYMFPISRTALRIYPLLGLEISYFNVEGNRRNDDNTEVGLNIGFGLEVKRFAVQLVFGASDVPDITLTALYTF